ncbi:MAG: hypothetical protein M3O15_15190, partial [Acidobacteriota bacterium]|nr:hypothetical protein [Acidobacteriota bacterium]
MRQIESGDPEFRSRLRGLVAKSEALRESLFALRESIPPSQEETAEDVDLPLYPEVETEFRATIGAVLNDYLDPMIKALGAAVDYSPNRRDGGADRHSERVASIHSLLTGALDLLNRSRAALADSAEG